MKTTTIRGLRHDTSTVLDWVSQGDSVEVTRRGEPVAILSQPKRPARIARPDFAARLRSIYGQRVLTVPASERVAEGRGAS